MSRREMNPKLEDGQAVISGVGKDALSSGGIHCYNKAIEIPSKVFLPAINRIMGRLASRILWLPVIFLGLLGLQAEIQPAFGQEKSPSKQAPGPVGGIDFEKQVWPILRDRCVECHNGENDEGQLRLDSREGFVAGGVNGKLIGGSETDRTLLMQRILGQGDQDQMPLDADPLSAAEIRLIRGWIASGANWPANVGKQATPRKLHWSYIKPARPELPESKSLWPENPIDLFVLAGQQEHGLRPSPDAERAKLLRRVHLDLLGIPPTLEELDRFLADQSPGAYEREVDRLLASPLFGEKWARSWLDLARYADTNGFQADQYRSVWPYRDWVIRSMNSDMPFDRFTIEQMAGDLLPGATVDQKIATGFHRLTTCNVEAGVDPEQNRVNQIFDRINTTGIAWFATSFECMQCHSHKYDPFSQREYYQMFALFNNTPLEVKNSGNDIQYEFYGPTMKLPPTAEQQDAMDRLTKEQERLEQEIARLESEKQGDFLKWLETAKSHSRKKPDWIPLSIVSFRSTGGAKHKILDDQSVLLSGTNPDKDTYEIEVETDLPVINGFRFETLTHASLPGKGPGRHAAAGRPNFVVNELTAIRLDNGKPIKFIQPVADFSQSNFSASGLFDGDPKTGWAINPQFGKDHFVSALVSAPINNTGKSFRIRFRLLHNYGGGRNIGRLRISALVGKRHESLPAKLAKLLTKKKLLPRETRLLQDHFLAQDLEYKKVRRQLEQTRKKLANIEPETTLVMVESSPRETRFMKRGNFKTPGEKVSPGTPSVLHAPKSPVKNRLDFARWIVDPENPLTARVVVNRYWAEIFGRGLVNTLEDFGTQGDPPTHPELLDWLAVEFMESGWSRKHILRLIVTSHTYRQSSRMNQQLREQDPKNAYLARGPRFRLPAESIRDSFLLFADQFANRMGGPPIYPPQPEGIWRHVGRNEPKYDTSQGTDRYRRGIYVFWRRSAPYPEFVNFDAPDRASCVVKRPITNTPLQALTLLNDHAFYELMQITAGKISQQNLPVEEALRRAFRTFTMRHPNPAEFSFLRSFYAARLQEFRQDAKRAAIVSGNRGRPPETAAWVLTLQVLFNLDETITKE